MVDDGGIWSEARVAVEELVGKCLPKWTRRSELGGRDVRRDRSWRRVGMVVEDGMCRGTATDVVRVAYMATRGVWRTFSTEQLDEDLICVYRLGYGV
jgi:hypothetical protein